MIKSLFTAIVLLAMVSLASAADVNLAWDANEMNPDGYQVFMAKVASGRNPLTVAFDYAKPAWTGSATTCTLTGLEDGQLYVFVCRAFIGENKSGDSNRVVYETPQIRLRVEQ